MQNYLLPNTAFVLRARSEIRAKLVESLCHLIFEVFSAEIDPPFPQDVLVARLSPDDKFPNATIFALHGALLKAALEGNTSALPALYRIMQNEPFWINWERDHFTVTALSDAAIGADSVFLLKAVFADDVGLTTTLVAPPQAEVARSAPFVDRALQVLAATAPDWHGELLLLASQVYLAVPEAGAKLSFAGAAVFDAFGALLMNPSGFRSDASVLMALVHESSHQHMFLYHLNDPIVLNDADASYKSPLRVQPRPMEGIFHALWVSARMVAAAEAILKSPDAPDWSDDLRGLQDRARIAFHDCEQTVAEHADLSDLGRALFESARKTVNAS